MRAVHSDSVDDVDNIYGEDEGLKFVSDIKYNVELVTMGVNHCS